MPELQGTVVYIEGVEPRIDGQPFEGVHRKPPAPVDGRASPRSLPRRARTPESADRDWSRG